MFIIFGWGFSTTRVFGAVFPMLCPNCQNERFWVLKRVRRWFTLFFIPVFPYESTHALMCPVCGVGKEMGGVELKRAKLYAETNSAYQAGVLGEDDYTARLAAVTGASDAQVKKGAAYVTATDVSPTAAPAVSAAPRPPRAAERRAATVPPPPLVAPVPVTPSPPRRAGSGAGSSDTVFCVRCGNRFDRHDDAFCPKCGAARPHDLVAS